VHETFVIMAANSDFRSEAPYTACWDRRRLSGIGSWGNSGQPGLSPVRLRLPVLGLRPRAAMVGARWSRRAAAIASFAVKLANPVSPQLAT
jgi:hypothetical protein